MPMVRTLFVAIQTVFVTGSAMAQRDLRVADLGSCRLVSGEVIEQCRAGYRTFGELNSDSSNAMLFPTWFTGTTEDLIPFIARGGLVDPSVYYVIAVDAFGNGVSSSPSNSPAQPDDVFPTVTIRDMVNAQYRLVTEVMGLRSLHGVIGLSMGGMQAFEWAVLHPDFVRNVVPIIGSPRLAAYDIVLWETELRILELFHTCQCEEAQAALAGLGFLVLNTPAYHARLTPRDSVPAVLRSATEANDLSNGVAYDIAIQLNAMIQHDVAAAADGSLERAASRVRAQLLVIVGATDHTVTPEPAIEFAEYVGAEVLKLDNDCGHLAPLCASAEVYAAVERFLKPS